MPSQEILELERQFWLGDVQLYERQLAASALMVFPPPAGVLNRSAVVGSIRESSRWIEVEMADAVVQLLNPSTLALSYLATARRSRAEEPYRARVGSVYLREGDDWKLAFHQHTPLTRQGVSGKR